MNKFVAGLLVGAGAALVVTAFGQVRSPIAPAGAVPVDNQSPASCPDAATRDANKRVVEAAFFPQPGGRMNLDNAFALMDVDYRQHNPVFKRFGEFNGYHGREEFTAMNEVMARNPNALGPPMTDPKAPSGNQLYKVIAECDMVVVLHQRYAPDPLRKGQYYEAFSFDAWRVRNGKLAEHWDGDSIPNDPPQVLKVKAKDLK